MRASTELERRGDPPLDEAELATVLDASRAFCLVANRHPGGALSCSDAVSCLYFSGVARLSVRHRGSPDRDKVVFSKGHAWAPQLFALWLHGYFPEHDVATLVRFGEVGSPLPRLPIRDIGRAIEMSTGSLGQGLSFATGLAVADRRCGRDTRVFVVMGDAECGEGQVWEAAASAHRMRVSSLTALIDANRYGSIVEMPREQWASKWAAFGFETIDVDGHDVEQITAALAAEPVNGPRAIVLWTEKGHGLPEGVAGTNTLSAAVSPDLLPELSDIEPLLLNARDIVRRRFQANGNGGWRRNGAPRLTELDTESLPSEPVGTSANPKAFVAAVGDALTQEHGVMLVCPDAIRSSGLGGLQTRWGTWSWQNPTGMVVECQIAEQDAASMAAGIAAGGLVSAIFVMEGFVWRMLDSIRQSIAYPGLPVVIVATSAGLSDELGPMVQSDTCIHAITGMLGLDVLEAGDANEARALFSEAVRAGGPTYLRVPHNDPVPVAASVAEVATRSGVQDGIWVLEREPRPEVVLLTAGPFGPLCRAAAAELRGSGHRVRVLAVCGHTRARRLGKRRLAVLLPPDVPVVSIYNGPPSMLAPLTGGRGIAMGVSGYGLSGSPTSRIYAAAGLTKQAVVEAALTTMR